MASAEEVARALPDTLPADFGDWDSEGSQAPVPGGSSEWEAAGGQNGTQKPQAQSDYLDGILDSFENKPRVWRPESSASNFVKPPVFVKPQDDFDKWQKAAAKRLQEDEVGVEAAKVADEAPKPYELSAESKATIEELLDGRSDPWPEVTEPVFAKPQKLAIEATSREATRTAPSAGKDQTAEKTPVAASRPAAAVSEATDHPTEFSGATKSESDSALFEIFSAKNFEMDGEETPAKKKWMIVGAAGGCSVLLPLILIVSMSHHGAKAAAKPVVQAAQDATDSQTAPDATASPAGDAGIASQPAAAAQKQQARDDQPARAAGKVSPAQPVTEAQMELMNDQLEAPRMIPREAKDQVAENGPPPAALGTAGAEGLGGNSAGGVFNGRGPSTARSVRFNPLPVSSGVEEGMLIQKTSPVYPAIAKAARVSGTVELHAIISKTGAVTDLHVLSGPVMLQGPAADAVRKWRYRPYLLNDEPVDVETTISVVFNLGN
jgi:periplasmic protein TonB